MARKVNASFKATLTKNDVKGGAWLAEYAIFHEGLDSPVAGGCDAFSNASAAKRWMKEVVSSKTTRKSIKLVAGSKLDAKGKPVVFIGDLSYKVEA